MLEVRNLAVLVEVDCKDGALLHGWREEGDGLLDTGNIVPGIASGLHAAEGGLGRWIAQALLNRGLGVVANRDLGFNLGVRQVTALIDHGCAAENEEAGRSGQKRKLHGFEFLGDVPPPAAAFASLGGSVAQGPRAG